VRLVGYLKRDFKRSFSAAGHIWCSFERKRGTFTNGNNVRTSQYVAVYIPCARVKAPVGKQNLYRWYMATCALFAHACLHFMITYFKLRQTARWKRHQVNQGTDPNTHMPPNQRPARWKFIMKFRSPYVPQKFMWHCGRYSSADKSLVLPTSRCILFYGDNISFDASFFIYINSTNIPQIMIMNRNYEHQNLLSFVSFCSG
jgi:hypothetical protein